MIYAVDASRLTDTSQERFARLYFDPVVVKQQIAQAANNGSRFTRIRQHIPIDLSSTTAAHQLTTTLSQHGFNYQWVRANARQDQADRSAPTTEYQELEIRWIEVVGK